MAPRSINDVISDVRRVRSGLGPIRWIKVQLLRKDKVSRMVRKLWFERADIKLIVIKYKTSVWQWVIWEFVFL
jgi:hypothetical protein